MDGTKKLKMADVIHKALVVELNEEGTKAAAVLMVTKLSVHESKTSFFLCRPSIYIHYPA